VRRPSHAKRLSRLIVVQAALAVVIGLLAGCGLSNGIHEYVVQFTPGTATSVMIAVGKDCPGSGKATLEAPGNEKLATNRAYPVRYDITNASDDDKSRLLACLKKHTIVRGVMLSNDES
jgi:hypothetical protein